MPAAVRPDEIAFNRASVALARSQALIASWLPPRSAEEAATAKSEEELQKEDKAIFTPGAEILGVGAEPPKEVLEGSFKRNQLSSNERLRQQLLGKNAKPRPGAASVSQSPHAPIKKPAPKPTRRQEDSEDEEEGRAAAFKSKKQKKQAASEHKATSDPIANGKRPREDDNSESDEDEEKGRVTSKQAAPTAPSPEHKKAKKKHTSFLDEMLEERSKKKKKKHKKNRGGAAE